ncbi:DEAD/DEAH box helicase family protein [Roseivirga sp. BDSF3-8]|uniref:type I restriction endonuclease subunit R n=1 Tax=Roseivirga sp. BDSF3-8 TaxID=3241598 RepID=UPI0035319A4C
MNEAQTRKEKIDRQLAAAGWNLDDRTQVAQELHTPPSESRDGIVSEPAAPYEKRKFADYVLFGKNGKPLAVIEAKGATKDAEQGREQAKQYCHQIQQKYDGPLPFCYYTNGDTIYFWDLGNYPPRQVVGYPTRDDLERLRHIRENRKPLASELISTDIAGRDYQIKAIRQVMEALEEKRRRFLLVMATGTGKTRTTIALIDALMRAGWVQRVLFLVDRIALRNQAVDAFKEHMPDTPRWPKEGEMSISKDRNVYVSTYPTMLNIIQDPDPALSPHFFDMVVVDESHRSIYNTYREVLRYFNTITLGLTATPTDVIDHNTFELFDCEDGLPTFAYAYEEALNNLPPYLSPFQVMKIRTRFQEEGINRRSITLEDQKKLIYQGKEVEEIDFEGSELEKSVINRGTNVTIVKEFMEECIKDPDGVLPGKTIFFCMTKAHARRVEEIFDALYPEYGGELAKVLVSDDPRVYPKGGLLDQFKYNDMPRVAISVDMLDTGVDIREVVNLVFAKPVYSYTKFWQMIGRGTRLLEPQKLRPWCPEKDMFLIMDCWDNFDYFKLTPKGKELSPQVPLPVRLAGIRIDKIALATDMGLEDIARKEINKLRQLIAQLPPESITIKEAAADLATVQDDAFWQHPGQENIHFLHNTIKPLFRTISQVDFRVMRFEKDVLETSLAHLAQETRKFDTLKENIITLVSELPLSINMVARQAPFIRQVQTETYWDTIDDAGFDALYDTIAPLIRYRQEPRGTEEQARLNLFDPLHTKEMVEFGPQNEAVSISRYREMVEARIAALTSRNPILQKLKAGELVSEEEAARLAEALYQEDPHITENLLRKVYKHRKARFIQFIKHILGIEILESFDEQVSRAVQQFIQAHTSLSSRQIEFLHLLRDYIIEQGAIERRNLTESPFADMHPKGLTGLFTDAEIKELVDLTDKFAA